MERAKRGRNKKLTEALRWLKKIPGRDRQSLIKRAEKGDEYAKKRLDEIVLPRSHVLFDAVLALHHTRNVVAGEPQPVQFSEIKAYCELHGFDQTMSLRLQNAMRAAEGVLLNGDDKT